MTAADVGKNIGKKGGKGRKRKRAEDDAGEEDEG